MGGAGGGGGKQSDLDAFALAFLAPILARHWRGGLCFVCCLVILRERSLVMSARLWFPGFVAGLACTALRAQMPDGNAWQKYCEKVSPVPDYSVTMVMQGGDHVMTSQVARLAPRMRTEMSLPGMGAMVSIVDPEAANDRGGKGVAYTLFPARKTYMKHALSPSTPVQDKATPADVKIEELGKETVDGMLCDKRRLTLVEGAGQPAHVVLVWTAPAVRNMPVRFESLDQGMPVRIAFRDYRFDKPAASLFVVPSNYVAGGMFPGMPGMGGFVPPAAPAADAAAADSEAGGMPAVPPVPAPAVTNAPSMGDSVKDAAKETTRSAVQEGVNRGLRKVLNW